MTTRIAFDHIAIALEQLTAAPPLLVGTLGASPYGGGRSDAFTFGQWRFAGGGRIEVLEPRGEDSFLHRFLARSGPGVHHVTFKVPSLAAVCDRARTLGYAIVGYDDSDPTWKQAFLHPKEALGIVVQLAEAGRKNDEAVRRWTPPPGPADPPAPVTRVGLRLRASDEARVTRQWHELLGGVATRDERGALVFRWPDSPACITVDIDPMAEEGPVAIEIASDRPVPIPDGRHPGLGVPLVVRRVDADRDTRSPR